VIVTERTDLQHLREAINLYERATGARLNCRKSRALPIGMRDTADTILSISYMSEAIILGTRFQSTLAGTIDGTWTRLANLIKGRAKEMYARDLHLLQRVHVTHTYLLSKIWYCAQTLPIPRGHARQIPTCILWFIWHGDMFRIPTAIMHYPQVEGGLDLLHVQAKCMSLFFARMFLEEKKRGQSLQHGWQHGGVIYRWLIPRQDVALHRRWNTSGHFSKQVHIWDRLERMSPGGH
jgi:hypothetical protein